MKRQFLPSTIGYALAAAMTFSMALGGEQPGPGLEIIDGATGIDSAPAPAIEYPPEPIGATPYQPPYDTGSAPAATYDTWQNDPFPTDAGGFTSQPYTLDESGQPIPVSPEPQPVTATQPADPAIVDTTADETFDDSQYTTAPAAQTELDAILADPVNSTLLSLDGRNRHFPGLDAAIQQCNLRMAADIVWDVLKKRRIVDATMKRGPGGSVGVANPGQTQLALDAINVQVAGADTPLQAASRINILLDAFSQPTVEDYSIGAAMEQCLIRMRVDIAIVRNGMGEPSAGDDGMFLELAKTYIRAATTCDFFIFPRRELAGDVKNIMTRAQYMFYPDGSSTAGDIAGITGNLFQALLMLDFYGRDDSWFRRDMGSAYRTLSQPGRYVADVAYPDMTVPTIGPRGTRELTAPQVLALDELFPKSTRVTRIGLAASDSYPATSTQRTYGGIYVTRSAKEPNARYMAIRVGPYGTMCNVPPHYDFGSISVMSRNIKFVVDAGGYGGDAAHPSVHSALSIEGNHVIPATYAQPGEHVDAVWRTNASIDYLTAKAGFEDGKGWQRTVVYVKDLPGETLSDYWLVLDSVDMNNDPQPRQAQIRYQLAPGIQAYHDGSGVLATAGFMDGSALRFFAIDAGTELTVSEGNLGLFPSHIYTAAGEALAAPAVTLSRQLIGDTTTATLIYPAANTNHKPVRIERDSDIIRGRTGAVIVDHGLDRIDVIAWAPLGTELVTPTLNLQMSADLAVFRIRNGKIARIDFVNLERFQAKEPEGGLWSMRVNGAAQTLTIEPERDGGWQVLADPANRSGATFEDVNFGPAITKRRFGIRPGEMRVIPR